MWRDVKKTKPESSKKGMEIRVTQRGGYSVNAVQVLRKGEDLLRAMPELSVDDAFDRSRCTSESISSKK